MPEVIAVTLAIRAAIAHVERVTYGLAPTQVIVPEGVEERLRQAVAPWIRQPILSVCDARLVTDPDLPAAMFYIEWGDAGLTAHWTSDGALVATRPTLPVTRP